MLTGEGVDVALGPQAKMTKIKTKVTMKIRLAGDLLKFIKASSREGYEITQMPVI
jgi:hypothetical protein